MAKKNIVRQRRSRERESSKKCREYISNNQYRKLKNKATETAEKYEE
ncbi:5707_t:CDS:2 [Dentiscutata heterogama]|uniref:5707_t:CDS:1 n=1 Tax=Dentiscutata heterogama TaxID=1316150 RepID=A0ACA9L5J6_9GLOM|nr:5707_t:CDS:2 [Dentiscutata heterogama]